MHSMLLATWLCLPLAPLNPLEQDTLASINLHFSAGVSSPNGIVSVGPELSARYEMLLVHPLILRGAVDYRYGKLRSSLYPRGDIHTTTLALEALYYRGTDRLTACVGMGAVYALNWFSPSGAASDSLWINESITDVDLAQQFGYRIILGLRFNRSYSLEIAVTELRPDIIKWGRTPTDDVSKEHEQIRTGAFRIIVGYLLPLGRH